MSDDDPARWVGGAVRAILVPEEVIAPAEAIYLPRGVMPSLWPSVLGARDLEYLNASKFGAQIAIDEAGLLTGRSFNRRASLLTWGRYVVGPAIVFGSDPWGATRDVPRKLEEALLVSTTEETLMARLFPGCLA